MEIGHKTVQTEGRLYNAQGQPKTKRLTVPGMAINMAKAMQYVRQNPINEQLLIFGSSHPEVHNKIDLTLMTNLEKMRMLNELKQENTKLRTKLDKDQATVAKTKATQQKAAEKSAIEKEAIAKHQAQNKTTI